MEHDAIAVSVVLALADRQDIVKLEVAIGTTVAQAVELSGLAGKFPQAVSLPLNCAIFGRAVAMTQTLSNGDRIEILRPLQIDPKESRRQAAAKNKLRTR